MSDAKLKDLVLQSLEHEQNGVRLYEAALGCVQDHALRREWRAYLDRSRHHVKVLEETCRALGLDPAERCPGREIVAKLGQALIDAVRTASAGGPEAAQRVAAECIVLAETTPHLDRELLEAAERLKGDGQMALRGAYGAMQRGKEGHLRHTRKWCRQSWLHSFGLDARPAAGQSRDREPSPAALARPSAVPAVPA